MTSSPLYQDLDEANRETRLLVMEPGFGQEPIRCAIQTICLLERPLPTYETISYVWGDAALHGIVYVNGHKLCVPSSAEAVLKRMRYTDRSRMIWIDSVCINQMSMEDRNYQVQLMCDIYSSTVSGLIWLGEDNGHAEEIVESLQALYDEAKWETNDFQNFKATVWPGWWDAYRPPSAVPFNAQYMAEFFDQPWFSRLWVVQEAALASHSICYYGSHAIPLSIVQRAAVWLYSKSKSTPGPLSGHSGLARAVHLASYTDKMFETPFQTQNNLLWMLNTLKQYDTSRNEDHVYGLVGLYQKFLLRNEILPQRLVPKYDNSLEYVLCNATKLAIEELRRLDPLLYVCHRPTDDLEHDPLPTWVPKWHRKQDLRLDHFPLNYEKYQASQQSEPWIQPPETDSLEILMVDGFSLDTAQILTNVFTQDILLSADQLLALLQSAESLLVGKGDLQGQVGHTLVASLDHRRTPMSQDQSTRGYSALLKHLASEGTIPPFKHGENDGEMTIAGSYHEALGRWLRNRRFFVTENGYIGTGPQVMQREDLVTILNGSSMPIILRPRSKRGLYAVVGQAYLFGQMSGEAVDVHRRAPGSGTTRFALL